jgi:hypothetical protein
VRTPERGIDVMQMPETFDGPSDQPSPPGTQLTEEEREVLTYLANAKRVDLRWLDEEKKRKIATVLDELHNGKRLSLLKVSKEVGRSYTAIWGLCRSLQIPTRSLAEADRDQQPRDQSTNEGPSMVQRMIAHTCLGSGTATLRYGRSAGRP